MSANVFVRLICHGIACIDVCLRRKFCIYIQFGLVCFFCRIMKMTPHKKASCIRSPTEKSYDEIPCAWLQLELCILATFMVFVPLRISTRVLFSTVVRFPKIPFLILMEAIHAEIPLADIFRFIYISSQHVCKYERSNSVLTHVADSQQSLCGHPHLSWQSIFHY